ncbi:DNA topoisomerase [Skermanella pratensis]|uniref:DNA topoisomerase n=1 Tax=Skermanella pratensis TaxID=2233999 RepID=UPI002483B63A|nr:DNA topoisomerase [Skermanella pratensis]
MEAKRTQPPPRYNEGTLIDAMQNAWRFVEDAALRDRLKEAKGIGTPATRAEVIKGLKRQNMLAADGKLVVPTPAGLHLFELLRTSAPVLVDPGTTAVWEMRLDEIVTGRAEFRHVIDGIATEAERLIGALRSRRGTALDLGAPAPPVGKTPSKRRAAAPKAPGAPRKRKSAAPRKAAPKPSGKPPTDKMLAFANSLATRKGVPLPPDVKTDFDACRKFLDEHAKVSS